jgi:hypothetical protein
MDYTEILLKYRKIKRKIKKLEKQLYDLKLLIDINLPKIKNDEYLLSFS